MSTATTLNKIEPGSRKVFGKFTEAKELLFELTKLRITFFVAVTTLVGYILFNGINSFDFLLPTIGVFLLAAGASAFNEYQERDLDSKMERTKSRPIPSGRISGSHALLISLILILMGSVILAIDSTIVLLLGLFTLIWYNLVYTPLKKITAYAIIPGSLVGALPPVIGWAAAGGGLGDIRILSFALFMFIWQIPHFWLLLLLYDDQYKDAGFPTMSTAFSFNQLVGITFQWIVFLVLSSSLIYFAGITELLITQVLLVISGIATLYFSYSIKKHKSKQTFKKSFFIINLYVLFILIILSIEKIT